MGFALAAPGYSVGDINDWFEGQSVSAGQLVPKTSALGPKLLGGEFAVPLFIIQGRRGFHHTDESGESLPEFTARPAQGFRHD